MKIPSFSDLTNPPFNPEGFRESGRIKTGERRKHPIEPYMNADKIQTMHFTRNSAIQKNSLQNFKKLTLDDS